MKYGLIGVIIVLILGAIWYAFLKGLSPNQDLLPITGENQTPQISMQQNEASGLKVEDITVGTGAEAKIGNTVSVHYTGRLENGVKFDSSLDRGQPFSFTIGQGMVIQGWDQGVPGMKVGGKRKLTIPGNLAYGERGVSGVIPPNATLVFEVELLDVQ